MKRVLIADDHAVVRRGLKEILAEHPDIDEPAEAADFPTVIKKVEEGSWDAVILDIKMPGGNVLDVLGRLRRVAPDLPVLVLSGQAEDQFAVRMIRAGASGYLAKECAADDLVEALRTVLSGRKYVSAAVGGALAAGIAGGDDRPLHEQLSDREFQVLLRIASGKTTTAIGKELHLSVKTVSTYRRRILDKFDMDTDAELVRYALENDLV